MHRTQREQQQLALAVAKATTTVKHTPTMRIYEACMQHALALYNNMLHINHAHLCIVYYIRNRVGYVCMQFGQICAYHIYFLYCNVCVVCGVDRYPNHHVTRHSNQNISYTNITCTILYMYDGCINDCTVLGLLGVALWHKCVQFSVICRASMGTILRCHD